MEQSPAQVGLQPLLGTGYSVTFQVTEQQSEGDMTTGQGHEGRMRTGGLPGHVPSPSAPPGGLSQVQLEGISWAHG